MSETTNYPAVAVVILNWNGWNYLQQFLPTVLHSQYPNFKVYVADNGSTDNSIQKVKSTFPDLSIIDNKLNYGFAEGYNQALKSINEEYLVLLNSDIEVAPNWLKRPIEILASQKDVAAVQPKIMDFNRRDQFEYAGAAGGWIDRFGYPFSKGRIFDILEKDNGQYNHEQPIFWASGAAMFIKKSDFLAAGGFDPYFFAHQEEIDLCWRLQLMGKNILSCPDSVVYHIGGGTLPKNNPQKVFLNFRNNLIILYKNLRGFERFYILSIRFALDAVSAWKNILSGQPSYFFAVMKAHFAFMGWWLFHQKQSVFPTTQNRKIHGLFKGNVVWEHFIRGKKTFAEIVN